jgi:hypothetical protein
METKDNSKALLLKLRSSNDKTVLEAIELFRKEGTTESLMDFIDVVLNHNSDEIIKKGTKVLYDIKDEKAINVIFTCIKDEKYSHVQKQLISVLWEAGMNCEDRLEDLVEISIKGTSIAVLEALTVIENIDSSYSFDHITELKMNITEAMEELDDELKNQLLNSLCQVLEGMIE